MDSSSSSAATTLSLISSMATRHLLADLAADYRHASGVEIRIESVGGVDAARRVQAGEPFDLVLLAEDAIAKLVEGGHVIGGSRRTVVDSDVAIAVASGAPRPDISTERSLRAAVLAAPTIGYSTGPSGNALLALFERWGLAAALAPKLRQARAGVPVASLVAGGEAALGFQQLSELIGMPGITVLGGMPPGLEIRTRFVGAIGSGSTQAEAARSWLDFCCAADKAALKLRHGMAQPSG